MICNKLKLSTSVFARKTKCVEIKNDIAEQFLNENHIQGYISGKHYGLLFNDELVAIMSFGKPRFNKNYDIELLRFAVRQGLSVVGGLSKLLKHYFKLHNKSILTYADYRYSTGNAYDKCGFKLISSTLPSYFYLNKNHTIRYSRMQFQKHLLSKKLEVFDSNLTEWENMQLNGYDRIWDCGNCVYVYK